MKMDPVLPVKEENPDTNQIRDVFMVIRFIDMFKFCIIFFPLPDDLFQKVHWILGSVTIGMDPCPLNIIDIFIYKFFSQMTEQFRF